MTRKYITMSVPVDSPEAKWLNSQKDRPRSFRQLVHMAQVTYGNQDLIDAMLEKQGIEEPTTTPVTQSVQPTAPKVQKKAQKPAPKQTTQPPKPKEQPTAKPKKHNELDNFKLPQESNDTPKGKNFRDLF